MFYNHLSPIPNTTGLDPRDDDIIPQFVAEEPRKRERREHSQPIPVNLSEYLNDDQRWSLRQMESFGWQLAFIRRPLFQDPVVVVTNEHQSQFGVLERDGSINTHAMIELRN